MLNKTIHQKWGEETLLTVLVLITNKKSALVWVLPININNPSWNSDGEIDNKKVTIVAKATAA